MIIQDFTLPAPDSPNLGFIWLNHKVEGEIIYHDPSVKLIWRQFIPEAGMDFALLECPYFPEVHGNQVPEYVPQVFYEGGLHVKLCRA